jgi:hypothetical protein
MWGPAGEKGVFLSYWLNHLNAANSDPTSPKWGVVRGPHTELGFLNVHGTLGTRHFQNMGLNHGCRN